MVAKVTPQIAEHEGYKFGFNDNDNAVYKYRTEKGLSEDIVREISRVKNEDQWMTDFRMKSYQHFLQKPMPTGFWGGSIQNYDLDFNDIYYFARASDRPEDSWNDVPEYIKDTFEKLGIPEAERKSLVAGVGAQYDSEVVYHSIREDLEKLGVIFVDMDSAVRDYPDLVRQHFGTIPAGRQQVRRAEQRRLVGRQLRLRPRGRQSRYPAPGLLPHQQGEHGPVRADADHRRGGQLRALRRRLHGADVLDRLAA